MTRSYQRFLAAVLCAVMAAMPMSVLAAGPEITEAPAGESQGLTPEEPDQEQLTGTLPEEGLTEGVAESGSESEEQTFPEGETAGEGEEPQSDEPAEPADPNAVQVVFNQHTLLLPVAAQMGQGITWVPVRGFFESMGCQVVWDQAKSAIHVTQDDTLDLELKLGDRLMQVNGRCWYMSQPCTNVNNTAMIPVRDAAKVFTAQVQWDGATKTVSMVGGPLLESGDDYYDQEDLLWIARIVQCEAGNQPLDGKVGVANVVLNRMKSAAFPSTAKEVIYDHRSGVQFVPTNSKRILNDPSDQCWLAAKLAMEGYETAPECLFFVTKQAAKSSWAGRNRTYGCTIGNHVFYK